MRKSPIEGRPERMRRIKSPKDRGMTPDPHIIAHGSALGAGRQACESCVVQVREFGMMARLLAGMARARASAEVMRRIRSVSFSQYGEDVLLSHLKPEARGFYVDVGAYHPCSLSNTYKLYLKGWRGITIEPNPDMTPLFRRFRPGDLHLQIGIASEPGELTYYRSDDPHENSFDGEWAMSRPGKPIDSLSIPCLPLSDALTTHAPSQHVDLLNVDCEARDLDVLRSLNWERDRPTAIIVEDFQAFHAGTSAGRGGEIRDFMFERGYAIAAQCVFSFIYVDRTAFGHPPNGNGFRLGDSQLEGLLKL
jgi:FkbM family methyltransferase